MADPAPAGGPAAAAADGLRPDQRRAVEARRGVAVVAGAGTGKTHMLAHRFLKHVTDGLDPLEIVAVTFTDRAAAELRSRIRSLLHLSLPSGSRARLTVEAAQVSTMHALAQRICREFPEQAGVAPDFTILDDLEGGLWLSDRIERALGSVPAAVFEAMPYQSVRAALSRLLSDPTMADAAFARPVEEWPAMVAAARAEALALLTGSAAWREAADIVRVTAGAGGDRRESTRREALTGLALVGRGEVAAGLAIIASLSLVGGSKKAFAEGDFTRLGEALKVLREAVRGALTTGLVNLELSEADERLAGLLPHLLRAYQDVRARLESEKRARRVLDFSDLEVHALRALADAEVVAHYQSRWRALLVDEFQDTNAVQAQILDALADTMTVTVVGDEKQSIYGFRGAKAEVFELYRSRIVARGGEEVVLSESFRSHGGLLHDLNTTFAPLLAERHQQLVAVRTATPGAGPFTSLLVVTGGGAKAARQLTEARALGAAIKHLVDEGTPVHDKATGALRPVRYSDIAVLARGWQALGVYGEVLPALGVPAVHTGGGNLMAMREVKDGINLLRALSEPSDDVALAALLRSPFFAVDDVTLYGLAARRGAVQGVATPSVAVHGGGEDRRTRVSLWEALVAEQLERDDVLGRARETIAELLTRRGSLAPSALLRAADSLTGHSAVLAGLPGGRRRLADYDGFVELVRRLEVGSEDLFTVWRRLRLLLAAEVEVRRPDLAAEGAVTLLTIHSSKGLEWPVVAVADLERRDPSQREPVFFDPAVGVAVRLDDGADSVEPALYRLLRAQAAVREEREARRLLYVALTRARDHLMLSAAGDRGGALDILEPGLQSAGVDRLVIIHDPSLASYPVQPLPGGPVSAAYLDDASARLVEPYVGRRSEAAGAPDPRAVGGPERQPTWSTALDLVAILDDTWSALAESLAAAGVRPPAADLAGRWLRFDAGGDGSAPGPGGGTSPSAVPAYVLLAWRGQRGVLVATARAVGGTPAERADAATAGAVDIGTVTVARRPHGASPGDEVARMWLLQLDPATEPGAAAQRVTAALSEVDDKVAG